MESMGYLLVRHCVDWCEFKIFESFNFKFQKYQKLNSKDLKNMKTKALKDNNFESIENFVEYELFLNNSYFNSVIRFLLISIEILKQKDLSESVNYFENMKESLA